MSNPKETKIPRGPLFSRAVLVLTPVDPLTPPPPPALDPPLVSICEFGTKPRTQANLSDEGSARSLARAFVASRGMHVDECSDQTIGI